MRSTLLALSLSLLPGIPLAAQELQDRNWQADFPPCQRHTELLKSGHMNVGVRFATSNHVLAEEFRSAMDFWASVLDLNWHEDDSENCAIEVLDGERALFEPVPQIMVARSQFPERSDFAGWIAFNPAIHLDKSECYRVAVHEIGHLLGLQHSVDPSSIMYGFDLEGQLILDFEDLTALGTHHLLRNPSIHEEVRLVRPPKS